MTGRYGKRAGCAAVVLACACGSNPDPDRAGASGGGTSSGSSDTPGAGSTATSEGSSAAGGSSGVSGSAVGGGSSATSAVADGALVDAGASSSSDAGDLSSEAADGATPTTDLDSAVSEAAPAASSGAFPFRPAYVVGADISYTLEDEARGATYADATGVKPIEQIMVENGFNYIRLRTFVDPRAPGGYSAQGFCDTAHTVAMAKRVKRCGMGLLVDFHMSDTWASLGGLATQHMPSSWVGLSQVVPSTPVSASTKQNNLFQAAHDYVYGVMQALVGAGVKPDMVQIGNETNSAMSGIPMSNWPVFAALMNAGIKAVRETDPAILVFAQHGRPRPDGNFEPWCNTMYGGAITIDDDAVCGSTYGTKANGADWQQQFQYEIDTYKKPVMSCEYTVAPPDAPAGALINGVMHGFANHMGLGSFVWEPTRYPAPNTNTLFASSGNRYTTNAAMAAYPALATSYGLPVPSGVCK